MDKERYSRVESTREAKDAGNKDCAGPQAHCRCYTTEGISTRRVDGFAVLGGRGLPQGVHLAPHRVSARLIGGGFGTEV